MENMLLWLYLVNAVLITVHEIDSAYWKEWDLFRRLFKGEDSGSENSTRGLDGFLLFHIPALFIVMYGIIPLVQRSFSGLIFSVLVCGCGLFAFSIHMICLRKGFKEFRTPVSISILAGTGVVSVVQLAVTFFVYIGR